MGRRHLRGAGRPRWPSPCGLAAARLAPRRRLPSAGAGVSADKVVYEQTRRTWPGAKAGRGVSASQLLEQRDPKVDAGLLASVSKLPVGVYLTRAQRPGRQRPPPRPHAGHGTSGARAWARAGAGAPSPPRSRPRPETPAGRAFTRRASSHPPLPRTSPSAPQTQASRVR